MILTAAALLMLAVPAAQAQNVNKESLLAKIAKQDAAVADVKKGAKASTWMARGKAYFEALNAPTKDLAENVPQAVFETQAGAPSQKGQATIKGITYPSLIYPYFEAYVNAKGEIFGWRQTREIQPGLLDAVLESYGRAYELDPKLKDKILEELNAVYNYCLKCGSINTDIGDFKAASDAYANAYRVQQNPVFDKPNAELLYYAGYMATMSGSEDAEMFKKGADYLERGMKEGYSDEDGNMYYYLFHCYYGQRDTDRAFVMKGRDALLEGIKLYPKNELIMDGLMNLYTAEEGVGDPQDLVEMIDASLANSPDNLDLWYGRGRVYYAIANKSTEVNQKLNYFDECIKSFENVVRIKPDDAQAYYFLGVFYTSKADTQLNDMYERHYTTQAEYDKDVQVAYNDYRAALPQLEKAIELNPAEANYVELAKQIYFRLRDESEEYQANYEKYNQRLQEMRN